MFLLEKGSCKATLSRFPKALNTSLKPSSNPPRFRSWSGNFGGVAVLVVLAVIALLLDGPEGCGAGAGADDLEILPPKENVRPAARSAPANGVMGRS